MANLNGKLLSANDFRYFLDMLNSRFKNKTSEEARKIALGKIEINEEQFDEYQRCLAYSVYSGAREKGILGSCLRVFDGDKRSMDYFIFLLDCGNCIRLLVLDSTQLFKDYCNESLNLEKIDNMSSWLDKYAFDASEGISCLSPSFEGTNLKAFVLEDLGVITLEDSQKLHELAEIEKKVSALNRSKYFAMQQLKIFKLSDWVYACSQRFPKIFECINTGD